MPPAHILRVPRPSFGCETSVPAISQSTLGIRVVRSRRPDSTVVFRYSFAPVVECRRQERLSENRHCPQCWGTVRAGRNQWTTSRVASFSCWGRDEIIFGAVIPVFLVLLPSISWFSFKPALHRGKLVSQGFSDEQIDVIRFHSVLTDTMATRFKNNDRLAAPDRFDSALDGMKFSAFNIKLNEGNGFVRGNNFVKCDYAHADRRDLGIREVIDPGT